MAFNSFSFFVFLPACLLLWLAFGARLRWVVLLVGSLAFYAFAQAPHLIAALLGVTCVSYLGGRLIHGAQDRRRAVLLWTCIGINLSVLVGLRYLPFLAVNANALLDLLSLKARLPEVKPLVAIGVSFFVFQGVAYLVDIYLELDEPELHFGRFALFMCFFPKLIQGPIERGEILLPQLRRLGGPRAEHLRAGFHLFYWGLFRKVVVADRLAPFVNAVYQNVRRYSGLPLLLATYLYSFQLYFDFSGYTDMALGTARVVGVRLTQNFDSPYLSSSVADFWRRWHISFSTWILDYVFKPLQLSLRDFRVLGTPLALLVAFFFSGLWHGPSWGFITWGLLHGVYLSASALGQPLRKRWHKRLGNRAAWRGFAVLRVVLTFHLVCLAWIFFRAPTVQDALYVCGQMVAGLGQSLSALASGHVGHVLLLDQSRADFVWMLVVFGIALGIGFIERRRSPDLAQRGELRFLTPLPLFARTAFYAVTTYLLVFHGAAAQSFMYTQF